MNQSTLPYSSICRVLIHLTTAVFVAGCSFLMTDRFTDTNGMVTVHATVQKYTSGKVEVKDVKTEYWRADILSTISGLSVEQYSATGNSTDLNVSLNSSEGSNSKKMYVLTEAIPVLSDGRVNVTGYSWSATDTEKELRLHLVTYTDNGIYSDEDLMRISQPNDNHRYIVDAWITKN